MCRDELLSTEKQPINGSCLCGLVSFQIIPPNIVMNNCYCSRCRKASGAAYGTFLHASTDSFKWITGEACIVHYIPKEGDPRPFCKQCGSRVPVVHAERKHVIIPAGLLSDAPDLIPSVNVYTGSKASWCMIIDDLFSFDENAPVEYWEKCFEDYLRKKSVSI